MSTRLEIVPQFRWMMNDKWWNNTPTEMHLETLNISEMHPFSKRRISNTYSQHKLFTEELAQSTISQIWTEKAFKHFRNAHTYTHNKQPMNYWNKTTSGFFNRKSWTQPIFQSLIKVELFFGFYSSHSVSSSIFQWFFSAEWKNKFVGCNFTKESTKQKQHSSSFGLSFLLFRVPLPKFIFYNVVIRTSMYISSFIDLCFHQKKRKLVHCYADVVNVDADRTKMCNQKQ